MSFLANSYMETGASHTELLAALGALAGVVVFLWKIFSSQNEKRFSERDSDRSDIRKRLDSCETDRMKLTERVASLEGQLLVLNRYVTPEQRTEAKVHAT